MTINERIWAKQNHISEQIKDLQREPCIMLNGPQMSQEEAIELQVWRLSLLEKWARMSKGQLMVLFDLLRPPEAVKSKADFLQLCECDLLACILGVK